MKYNRALFPYVIPGLYQNPHRRLSIHHAHNMAIPGKRLHKSNTIASFVLAIVLGSLAPDIDHVIKNNYQTVYGKGYGHIILVPLAILGILAAAHFGRRLQAWLLSRSQAPGAKELYPGLSAAAYSIPSNSGTLSEKSMANYALTGVSDSIVLSQAWDSLPNHGLPVMNTTTVHLN